MSGRLLTVGALAVVMASSLALSASADDKAPQTTTLTPVAAPQGSSSAAPDGFVKLDASQIKEEPNMASAEAPPMNEEQRTTFYFQWIAAFVLVTGFIIAGVVMKAAPLPKPEVTTVQDVNESDKKNAEVPGPGATAVTPESSTVTETPASTESAVEAPVAVAAEPTTAAETETPVVAESEKA